MDRLTDSKMDRHLAEMATENGDAIARDLLSIRCRSVSAFNGICSIISTIDIQRKRGCDMGRCEEILNELIDEMAESFSQYDGTVVMYGCTTYADKLRELLKDK